MRQRFAKSGSFFKVDEEQGIAYGWAIVCFEGNKPYFDLQGDHIPESVMVSALADFAKNSRVGKDQHQGDQVGEHLFLYPVTKATAEGLGITTNKRGAIVGYKPDDPADLLKIKNGERTGFSIGGMLYASEEAELGKGQGKQVTKASTSDGKKGRVFRTFKIHEISLVDFPAQEGATVGYVKSLAKVTKDMGDLAVTSLADGHQHTVDPDDVDDDGAGRTSYATGTGANDSYGHSHEWVTDAEGVISIVANAGHSHTVDAKVELSEDRSVDTLSQVTLVPAEGIGDGPGAISARRRTADLRTEKTAPSVSAMTDLEIAKLKADLLKAEQRATLTDAHRTHLSKLHGSDADTFLAKGTSARDAEIADRIARDPVVYTSKSTGRAFRASEDSGMVEMAKQLDTNNEELAKSRIERDDAQFAKSASENLVGLPFQKEDGKFDDAIALVKAVHTITDVTQRNRILVALKGTSAMVKMGGTAPGIGADGLVHTPGNGNAEQSFAAARDEFAKANDMKLGSEIEKARATSAFIKTAAGARAFQNYNASKKQVAEVHP